VAEAGDAAHAQSYYRRALAIEPSSREALDRIAVAAMMAGDARAKEDALREIRDASAWRSDGSLLFDVALLQLQLRRYEAAAGAFRRLQTVAPMELFASASRVVGRRSAEPRT
jgi:tetratricopeptide (TPR) repeat protein